MRKLITKIFATVMVAFLLCVSLTPAFALSNENMIQVDGKRKRGG